MLAFDKLHEPESVFSPVKMGYAIAHLTLAVPRPKTFGKEKPLDVLLKHLWAFELTSLPGDQLKSYVAQGILVGNPLFLLQYPLLSSQPSICT